MTCKGVVSHCIVQLDRNTVPARPNPGKDVIVRPRTTQ